MTCKCFVCAAGRDLEKGKISRAQYAALLTGYYAGQLSAYKACLKTFIKAGLPPTSLDDNTVQGTVAAHECNMTVAECALHDILNRNNWSIQND